MHLRGSWLGAPVRRAQAHPVPAFRTVIARRPARARQAGGAPGGGHATRARGAAVCGSQGFLRGLWFKGLGLREA